MKKIFYIIFSLFALYSCKKDILDIPDPSSISNVWVEPNKAEMYLNDIYGRCLPTEFGGNAGNSDETVGGRALMYGLLIDASESSYGSFNPATYKAIRFINIAIENLAKSTMEEKYRKRYIGEAYFFRAWTYWDKLVKYYGGVPLILIAQDPFTDEINIPRNTTKECIEQIFTDLDSAIANLPAFWTNDKQARLTRGAALSLKGRIALFWASPQFNPNNSSERWQFAYEANKAAFDTVIADGYLFELKLKDIFLKEGNYVATGGNVGAIFKVAFDKLYNVEHQWEYNTRPVYSGGLGSNCPTWNLVQAFPMKNGMKISDPKSGYDSVLFWKDRDPRLEYTIARLGAEWKFADIATKVLNNYVVYEFGTDGFVKKDKNGFPMTKDINETNSSTGFYCKKGITEDLPLSRIQESSVDWIEIRLAEVMLNLAECANEIGLIDEAYYQVGMVRRRAGISKGDGKYGLQANMDKDKMREAIMLERQIEFAFENKRFWDLRRRKAFVGDVNSGIDLDGANGLNDTYRYSCYMVLDSTIDVDYFQDSVLVNIDLTDNNEIVKWFKPLVKPNGDAFNYLSNYDFFPISQDWLNKCPAVLQTIGWEKGRFDPLAE